ncbi:ABC transporter ATP-binding protein [Paraburkholderia pallida]|uniref:ABC transporter ATP-binding protein n=1 Tax=Paraburkholderia pallida TaxID=2547399 RepID=A0A4P7D7Q1_9BURK|nr:ABC transporter ATP-binding protein [Paraburkholderia pallida]QBR02692.1 ABC transporter ATP-binding protein [Paraburkholderia pallida]
MNAPALQVDNLCTHFTTPRGVVRAVNGVSFSVGRGEILGVVGESGSGKSQTGYSIMGLIDAPGKIVGGSIRLAGEELRGLSEAQWRRIRGNRIAMIFQDPMMTLNPVLRIDTQMVEAVLAHRKMSRRAALDEARAALVQVGIPAPDERLRAYPHQFSGGMRQRVAIAIALINRPDVVIADEPTTALDVTIQAQILGEIQQLCRNRGTALIWITHDLSVVAGLVDRVCVMYGGRIVEQGSVDQVLDAPRHPYTRGLMDSIPSRNPKGAMLRQIPGAPLSLINAGEGCAFRTRCGHAAPECAHEIPETAGEAGHTFRCIRPIVDAHEEMA